MSIINGTVKDNLESLRALCRYETHGGYVWAAIMYDGELMCVPCLRRNYRRIFRDTRTRQSSDWALIGYANSGEAEATEWCANCNSVIWEIEDAQAEA